MSGADAADRSTNMEKEVPETFKVTGEELLKKVKEFVHEGNVRKIIIKNEQGETYMEIPLTVGLVGALAAPVLAAVGALAALAGKFTIDIVRKES
jgi:hypothetical protein